MKFLNKFVKGFATVVISLLAAMLMSGTAYAIPYTGDNTPPAPSPAFNVYTGVPSEGNEADFLRGKVATDTEGSSVNDVRSTCETGKRFTLRVYVHNGASKDLNGDGSGPSVAKDSKVAVNLNNSVAKSIFNPNATISASNATAVTDGMTITCTDGKTVDLSYINGSAKQYSRGGIKDLSDTIVTTGAAIGTDAPNGDVWGCWEQRVYVTLTVEVKEKPVVIPSSAICKLENGQFFVIDDKKRTVRGTIKSELTNATVVSYLIDWGDGSKSTKQTDTYSYATNGKYTIQASFVVKLNDGSTKTITGSNCATVVEFKEGKPPVVTPPTVTPPTVTKLASTGPASTFSIFAMVSIIGAVMHRMYTARKATQE